MDGDNNDLDLRTGYMLGPWAVQPNRHQISQGSDIAHLEPKVMEVLCLLARQQGEVVSRTSLIDQAWKGTYVTDEVLSRAISVLRKQLGDDRKNPEYIVTIPKSGYRLIMPVTPIPDPVIDAVTLTNSVPVQPQRSRWLIFAAGILFVLLLLTLGNIFRAPVPAPSLDPRSPTLFADLSDWFELIIRGDTAPEAVTNIAVLPFDDISEQPGNAFLSDGLTDELISSLGQLDGLKVVARSSSLGFRHRYEDVRTIGEILQVQAVVEGTVKRSGDHIRISAQLNSTEDGYVMWAQTYDRELEALLSLQAEISTEIVSALREKLELNSLNTPELQTTLPDKEAYQLYLNGRFMWKLRGEAPLRKSIALFEQALQLDPEFNRARLALVNSLLLLPYYSDEAEEQAFERALRLLTGITATTNAEAGEIEAIKGFVALRRWQWQRAEEQFHKALLLAPNNPNIYVWYSQLLSWVGRNADALKTAQQARDLDAVSPVVNHRLAVAWMWNGDNVRAAEQYARGAELGFVNLRSPGYLVFLLRMQRFEEARQVIRIMYTDRGVDPQWMMQNIEAISTFDGDDDLVTSAIDAVNRNEVLPIMELGLWLYLDQPGQVYALVKARATQKKHLVFELLFSEEARAFRDSDEFSELVEEHGLETYWDSWRGPDEAL
jgi:TolB-like protein/DNA-binding winged helix-turn-helix (wHTH) protein